MYLVQSTAKLSTISFTACSASVAGAGAYIESGSAAFIDLKAGSNSASSVFEDIHNAGGAYSCATSCLAGEHGNCR